MEDKRAENPKIELYNDASGNIFYNLDEHCKDDQLCIGAVLPFKDTLYFDKQPL